MRIGARAIEPGGPPYVIAEIGVNHDGDPARATMLVDAAADAGADAVKLQLFRADALLSAAARLAAYQRGGDAADPAALLRGLELAPAAMAPLVERARTRGLHAICTVFSVELVAAAEALGWDAYKTASPDVVNRPLLDALRRTGRPLLVSTGAATVEEVETALGWLDGADAIVLHCVSAYPTPDDDAALAGRLDLAARIPCALGYSDHTTSVDTGALAVASGARLLEKHLTHDRGAAGPDHAASLDPDAFAEYVALAHRAWRMLGPPVKRVLDVERDVRAVSRQSLTTVRALAPGDVLAAADLTVKRPGDGLPPAALERVVGRIVRAAVAADVPLREEHLA